MYVHYFDHTARHCYRYGSTSLICIFKFELYSRNKTFSFAKATTHFCFYKSDFLPFKVDKIELSSFMMAVTIWYEPLPVDEQA